MGKLLWAIMKILTDRDEKNYGYSYDVDTDYDKLPHGLIFGGVIFVIALFFRANSLLRMLLLVLSAVVAGYRLILKSVMSFTGRFAIDEGLLMTAAVAGAFAIGRSIEGAAAVILYDLGEMLRDTAVAKSRHSIKRLERLKPESVHYAAGGKTVELPAERAKIGDKIRVFQGEHVPLDGVVVEGESRLDTSALTGEAEPRAVGTGDLVMAGCVNLDGTLELSVKATLEDSAVSLIVKTIENAEKKRAASAARIIKLAGWFTVAVAFVALFEAVAVPLIWLKPFDESIYRGLTLLVLACPGALVVSVPLIFFAGIGGAARSGILIKSAGVIDRLEKATSVVFDKTGTLTEGRFEVAEVVADGISKEQLMYIAAHAESCSSHPVAKGIVEASGVEINADRIKRSQAIPGKGVVAQMGERRVTVGNSALMEELGIHVPEVEFTGTVVYVAVDMKYTGHILLKDSLRPSAINAVDGLKSMGIERLVVFTGDKYVSARAVGDVLGIGEVYAECLPENKADKLRSLREMQMEGEKLVYVGEGIKDASVLSFADVGIAMGKTSSAEAIKVADVVMLSDNLSTVPKVIWQSQSTKGIVYQNTAFSFLMKLLFVVLVLSGAMPMWGAVLADIGVTLLTTLNAMRTYSGYSVKMLREFITSMATEVKELIYREEEDEDDDSGNIIRLFDDGEDEDDALGGMGIFEIIDDDKYRDLFGFDDGSDDDDPGGADE